MENYSCDNSGNRMPPHPNMGDPILASGARLRPSKNTNTEYTVVPGAVYAITSRISYFVFGIATTATDANIIWACPIGKTIIIKIPNVPTYTSLHYQGYDDNPELHIRRLAMP